MQKPDWIAPLFPWEQRVVSVNGRRMAFIDEGPRDGRPVLLLSGNPTWAFLLKSSLFTRGLVSSGSSFSR